MSPPPRFSIITVLQGPSLETFEETVASVLAQTTGDWEWVLVDDCSPDPSVRERLDRLAAAEPRVRVHFRGENGGAGLPLQEALDHARGELLVILGQLDLLAARALTRVAEALEAQPQLDFLYSDHERVDSGGARTSRHPKPDWSPERLRNQMYTTHLSVLRRSVVEAVGGFRPGYDGAEQHDLVLRVTERARKIVHVPELLYRWREAPDPPPDSSSQPGAWDGGLRAVQDHLDRVGIAARATKGRVPGLYRIDRQPDITTPVSVIIPTIGSTGYVRGEQRCMVVETIRSLRERSAHQDLEFVVVYDSATPASVLTEIRGLPLGGARLRLVEFKHPFSFSEKCNIGALHATADVLLFLNDDMEALSEGVVERLIAPLRESDVGATGAKLLFEDSRVQHAGLTYGRGRIADIYQGRPHPSELGSDGELWINREVTALTGACLAVPRAVFEDVGGFAESLPVNYNDVDFCRKVESAGRRVLWLHDVVLFHFESSTRVPGVHDWETRLLTERWGDPAHLRERFTTGRR